MWSWALPERPLDVMPLDSFPAFHGTRRFNTEFTRGIHLFLSLARPIQSTSPHPTSPSSILILSTHLRLGLPSGPMEIRYEIYNFCRCLSFYEYFRFAWNVPTWHWLLHQLHGTDPLTMCNCAVLNRLKFEMYTQ
jgi:hypothetical protein